MWKYILIFMAVAGAISAFLLAQETVAPKVAPPLLHAPVKNPFTRGIAAAGIIEPASENVTIGVSEPGLVVKIYVTQGQAVKRGDPLYKLDTRSLEAELLTEKAAIASAEAELQRVMANGRKEDEPLLRAHLSEAMAGVKEAEEAEAQAKSQIEQKEWALKDFETQVTRLDSAVKANASPAETLDRARFSARMAQADLNAAKSNLEVMQARTTMAKARADQGRLDLEKQLSGPWEHDVKKARVALDECVARLQRQNLEIERRTVRAPLDASVIRLNLREGEYANSASVQAENAAIVLGDLSVKHVRADIDEFDAPRLTPGMRAIASLKGGAIGNRADDQAIELEFVRIEPFVIPKRAVTNSQQEIVDTRVLQVIYKVISPAEHLFVGQQVDVFIDDSANIKIYGTGT